MKHHRKILPLCLIVALLTASVLAGATLADVAAEPPAGMAQPAGGVPLTDLAGGLPANDPPGDPLEDAPQDPPGVPPDGDPQDPPGELPNDPSNGGPQDPPRDLPTDPSNDKLQDPPGDPPSDPSGDPPSGDPQAPPDNPPGDPSGDPLDGELQDPPDNPSDNPPDDPPGSDPLNPPGDPPSDPSVDPLDGDPLNPPGNPPGDPPKGGQKNPPGDPPGNPPQGEQQNPPGDPPNDPAGDPPGLSVVHDLGPLGNEAEPLSIPNDATMKGASLPVLGAPQDTAPVITSQPTVMTNSGTNTRWQLAATGTPPITWSLDGAPTGVSIGSGDGILTVSGTVAGDIYYFQVIASNTAGQGSQSMKLIVSEAPVINSANHATFVQGVGGTFQCTATGTPIISWSLSGAPAGVSITNQGGKLTVSSTVTGGTYTFDITANNSTRVPNTQSFTLTVQPPLSIASHPADVTVAQGENASFTVAVAGARGTLTYEWMYSTDGGATWQMATDDGWGSATLTVRNAQLNKSGTRYRCNVTDSEAGSAQSNPALLTVRAVVPAVITSANKVTFVFRYGGAFPCTATGDAPITWSLRGEPAGVSIGADGKLTVGVTVPVGTHTFTIIARNEAGSPWEQSFTLTVRDAASITSDDSAAFIQGIGGTFQCTASAPSAWSLSGEPAGVSIGPADGQLTVADTVAGGVHTFDIRVTDAQAAAQSTQSFTLTVRVPAVITSGDSATFVQGTGGTFPCTATGDAPLTWSLKDAPAGVSIGADGILSVEPTVAGGTHFFYIAADNAAQKPYTQSFTLTVRVPAVITSGDSATFVQGTGGTFPCTATGDAPLTWSLKSAPAGVSIGADGKLTVEPTVAGGTHTFDITADNAAQKPHTQSFTLTLTVPSSGGGSSSSENREGVAGAFDTPPAILLPPLEGLRNISGMMPGAVHVSFTVHGKTYPATMGANGFFVAGLPEESGPFAAGDRITLNFVDANGEQTSEVWTVAAWSPNLALVAQPIGVQRAFEDADGQTQALTLVQLTNADLPVGGTLQLPLLVGNTYQVGTVTVQRTERRTYLVEAALDEALAPLLQMECVLTLYNGQPTDQTLRKSFVPHALGEAVSVPGSAEPWLRLEATLRPAAQEDMASWTDAERDAWVQSILAALEAGRVDFDATDPPDPRAGLILGR